MNQNLFLQIKFKVSDINIFGHYHNWSNLVPKLNAKLRSAVLLQKLQSRRRRNIDRAKLGKLLNGKQADIYDMIAQKS